MDLLDKNSGINLADGKWKIYARNNALPPHHIGESAEVKTSIISEGGDINGSVIDSVIFQNVTIKSGAYIEHSVIMPNVVIEEGAKVCHAIIAQNTTIGKNAVIGGELITEDDITVIGANAVIPEETQVEKGAMLEGRV